MSSSSDTRPSTVAVEFLQVFLRDREQGHERSLAEYQAMFPGGAAIVASEYEAIMAPGAAPPEAALEAVTQSDRYRDREVVARGGMGTVQRVRDTALGRLVAMKLLGDGDGSTGFPAPEALARFLHEARITARLQHPGIVPVLDLGIDERQQPYYTMPLIAGDNLAVWLQRGEGAGPPKLPRVLDALERVANAVAHAHSRHIIHRDLKPANVMIGADGAVYVVDWGVARELRRAPDAAGAPSTSPAQPASPMRNGQARPAVPPPDRPGPDRPDPDRDAPPPLDLPYRTQAGDVLGTPAYMAPEQANGDDSVDERSDVYALGAILYHVLAGGPPYAGQARTSTLDLVRAAPPAPLMLTAPTAPSAAVAICQRAMARDPADRYPTAREFAADLRAFLDNRVVQAHATGPVAELRTWMRRNRGVATASVLAVTALIAGTAISLQQKFAADDNALMARENRNMAFTAAEELLAEFGERTLANDPAADPLRRALAARTLAFYRHFTTLRGEDPGLAERIARSHFRIGLLEAKLGNVERSLAALSQARTRYARLVTDAPNNPVLRLWLAMVETESCIHRLRTEPDAAIDGLQGVIEAVAELPLPIRESDEALHVLASARHNIALALVRQREFEAALALAVAKVDVGRELVARLPDSPLARHRLASGQLLLGGVQRHLGEFATANTTLEHAATELAEMLANGTPNRGLTSVLAEIENLRGTVLLRLAQPEAAAAAFERAAERQRQLATANPNVRDHQCHLAGSLCNLAVLRRRGGDSENSLELLEEALDRVRRALAIDPRDPRARDYRRIIGRELNNGCFELGRYDDAARHTQELVTEQPDRHDWFAAYAFAACTTLSSRDDTLTAAERQRRVQEYGDATMRHLQGSRRSDTIKVELLEHEVFSALRSRADFLTFLAEVGR